MKWNEELTNCIKKLFISASSDKGEFGILTSEEYNLVNATLVKVQCCIDEVAKERENTDSVDFHLCFWTKAGHHLVEFPYKTSTELTLSVMKLKNLEKRIQLVKDYIDILIDPSSDELEYYDNLVYKCEKLMRDETLELSKI